MQVYNTYLASVDVFMVAAMRLDEDAYPAEGAGRFTRRLEQIIQELSEWSKGVYTRPVCCLNKTELHSIHTHFPLPCCTPAHPQATTPHS